MLDLKSIVNKNSIKKNKSEVNIMKKIIFITMAIVCMLSLISCDKSDDILYSTVSITVISDIAAELNDVQVTLSNNKQTYSQLTKNGKVTFDKVVRGTYHVVALWSSNNFTYQDRAYVVSMSTQNETFGLRNYQVTDITPSGGLIFYDRGYYEDGWRYMEVAPRHTEFSATWFHTTYPLNIESLEEGVGYGDYNTELINSRLPKPDPGLEHIQENKASQRSAKLEVNGITGWFLPSLGELSLIHSELYENDLGDIRPMPHWSSSVRSYNPIVFHFGQGRAGYGYKKDQPYWVRAVRKF